MIKYTHKEILRLGSLIDNTFGLVTTEGETYTRVLRTLLSRVSKNKITLQEALFDFFVAYIGDLSTTEVLEMIFKKDPKEMPKYLTDPILSFRLIATWRLELRK